jgi:hypothetical protein
MDDVLLDIVDEAAGLVMLLQARRGAGPAGPAPPQRLLIYSWVVTALTSV